MSNDYKTCPSCQKPVDAAADVCTHCGRRQTVDLSSVIANWQTKLLQLDRRNSLLYFKEKSSVSFKDQTVDGLMDRLQRTRKGLAFPYAEHRRRTKEHDPFDDRPEEPTVVVTPGDVQTDEAPLPLQRLLRALHRRDRKWEEEQGINVLFVAFGFLNWIDDSGDQSRAPLLLLPADLNRASPRDPWRLSLEDDDLQVNETLVHRLRAFGVALPEVDHERPSDYLRDTETAIAAKKGWSISTKTALATFPFGKMAMWQDLESLRVDGTDHSVVNALAGDVEALRGTTDDSNGLPAPEELAGGGLDDLLPVKQQFAVLEADHSQLRAIELVRRGGHVVIHGPPGTGKSQTIANIIATLLGDGKRVLFVSEKTAALDVVKRRLEECELGVFCLDLHSDRARKSSVYGQLAQALNAPRDTGGSFPFDKLERQRERLNSVCRALHERRHPLGLSVFEVHGRFARVRELDRVDFPISDVAALDEERLDQILTTTAQVTRRREEFRTLQTSPWRALRSAKWRIELPDDLRALSQATLEAYDRCRTDLIETAAWLGASTPTCANDASSLADLAEHLSVAPGVPEGWLTVETLERLHSSAKRAETLQADRIVLEQNLAPNFAGDLPDLEFERLSQDLKVSVSDRHKLTGGLGQGWRSELCPEPSFASSRLQERILKIENLQKVLSEIATGPLDAVATATFPQARGLALDLRRILSEPIVPVSWLTPQGAHVARQCMSRAKQESEVVRKAEADLLGQYDDSLLDIVSPDMLVRFRTDHQRFFRILTRAYRADMRSVQGCQRQPRKISLAEALQAVQSSLELHSHRERWSTSNEEYRSVLGDAFDLHDTDWQRVNGLLDATENAMESWGLGAVALVPLLSDEQFRSRLAPKVAELESTVRTIEADESLGDLHSPTALAEVADRALRLKDAAKVRADALDVVTRLNDAGTDLWPQLRKEDTNWDELVGVLDSAVRLQKIRSEEKNLLSEIAEDFGHFFGGAETDWATAITAAKWVEKLFGLTVQPISKALLQHGIAPESPQTYEACRARLRSIGSDFEAASSIVDATLDPSRLGWDDWCLIPFEDVESPLRWIGQNADSVGGWIDFASTETKLDELIFPGVLRELRDNTEDSALVPDLILRRVYAAWLDAQYAEDDRLQFQPRHHEALRDEFRKLDQEHVKSNRQRVRSRCFSAFPSQSSASFSYGQLGKLNHQLSLSRRQLPIRKLAQEIPHLLQTLKPCLLMSPVAVSQYLPRDSGAMSFDVVIFDEASQVFPHDAVPAISRASQVVVVGDQKQLPPTSFFRSDMDDDDEADEEETEDRLEGVESILDAMVGMVGAGVHRSYLSIHYRSRHEDLIRYSNHYFYDDGLLTFPSPQKATPLLGVEDVYLPEARYDAGATRTNREEAEEVVRRVFHVMRTRPAHESVGVVTLSRSQADLIEELINAERLTDSSLDANFDSDLQERFFVKNLENVQGDERDHIILSIGYGPTVGSGAVPNRFGPINRVGGERRLNVAVSRARRSMTLVRSIRPDQITSETDGARLLRRYIEFVQDPERAFEAGADADPSAESESPFEEAVFRALTERGYKVARQVGCFGYRLDLAIMSEDGSRFDLGIECDGATYHSSPAARDRDWLRQQVLEGLGWTIHRIWSTDWIKGPQDQIAAVVMAVDGARARLRESSVDSGGTPNSVQFRRDIRSTPIVSNSIAPHPPENLPESELAEVFGFETYEAFEVKEGSRLISIHDESWARLQQLVRVIVDTEGPVHESRIIDVIRRTYGAGRAGRQIREVIHTAIEEEASVGSIERKTIDGRSAEFLDRPNRPRRTPARGESPDGREIEHIWQGEMEAGLLQVVESCFGIERDEAVTATARGFGFSRVGATIREALGKVVDYLIEAGFLMESSAGLSLPDAGGNGGGHTTN